MTDSDEPKIIVDDDWKTQVEQEKEQLAEAASQPEGTESETPGEVDQLPPATFPVLMSTLATQAMAGLGLFPDPSTGEPNVQRPMAKHFIDTLAMLQEKTQGNLSDEESTMLRDTLHQLRMAYMSVPAAPQKPEAKKSSIELA